MSEASSQHQHAEVNFADWQWMFVEVFGHRRHAGRCREEERFGAKLLRIDVPVLGDPDANGWQTLFYNGSSIFSLRFAREDAVLRRNRPYEPPPQLPAPETQADDADADEEAE